MNIINIASLKLVDLILFSPSINSCIHRVHKRKHWQVKDALPINFANSYLDIKDDPSRETDSKQRPFVATLEFNIRQALTEKEN